MSIGKSDKLDLLREFSETLSLCYVPACRSGADAALLGAFILSMDIGFRSRVAEVLDPSRLHLISDPNYDPFGYALGAKPVCNRQQLARELTDTPVKMRLAVLERARWNVFHVELAVAHLLLINSTALYAGITGAFNFAADAATLYRTKQQYYYLRTDPDDWLEAPLALSGAQRVEWFRDQAKNRIGKFRLWGNWQSPIVHHRTPAQKKEATGDVVVEVALTPRTREYLTWVQRDEIEQIAAVNAACLEALQTREPGAPRRLPPRTFSGAVHFGGLSQSAFNELRQSSFEHRFDDPGALLATLRILSCFSSDDLGSARVQERGEVSYLATPVRRLAHGDKHDARLHMPVRNSLLRRIPRDLAIRFRDLHLTMPHERFQSAEAEFLSRQGCTVAALNHCIRWQVPVWHGLPWILAEFGLGKVSEQNGQTRAPGYRSYLVYAPAYHEQRHLDYLGGFGLTMEPDPNVAEIPFCGSDHCVRPEIAATWFPLLRELLDLPLPTTYRALAVAANAVAALCALIEILSTFCRNYPAAAPLMFLNGSQFRLIDPIPIIYEKVRPRPITYPPRLQRLLGAVASFFHCVVLRLGEMGFTPVRPDSPDNFHGAYGFLPLSPCGRTIPLFGRRQRLIADGLARHPLTSDIAGVHPNAPRNLSYLILTQDEEHDKHVFELHDHFAGGGQGAFSGRRGEQIAQTELRIAAAEKIFAVLRPLSHG